MIHPPTPVPDRAHFPLGTHNRVCTQVRLHDPVGHVPEHALDPPARALVDQHDGAAPVVVLLAAEIEQQFQGGSGGEPAATCSLRR